MSNTKKVLVMMACIFIVSLPCVFAQDNQMGKGGMGMGMMGGEMMGTGMMCKCGEGAGMKGMSSGMKMENKMDFDEMFNSKISFILMNSKDLGLSDEQMTKIKELKYKIEKSMIMRKAEMEIADIDIMQALVKDDIDTVAIGKVIDKKYESKKMESKELVDACASSRMILTKEQQKMLKDILSKKMMMSRDSNTCPMCGSCPMMREGMKDGMGCPMMKDGGMMDKKQTDKESK
jgi:hypothetical protein